MRKDDHLLVLLIEECAEIQQRATKAIRFGMGEVQPGQPKTNRDRLSDEVSDMIAILGLLQTEGLLNPTETVQIVEKIEKVKHYMDYSRKLGRLEPA